MATLVVLRLVQQRGDHQPRYKKNSEELGRTTATDSEKIAARSLTGPYPVRPRWRNSTSRPCLSCRDGVGPNERDLSNWGSLDGDFRSRLAVRSLLALAILFRWGWWSPLC